MAKKNELAEAYDEGFRDGLRSTVNFGKDGVARTSCEPQWPFVTALRHREAAPDYNPPKNQVSS